MRSVAVLAALAALAAPAAATTGVDVSTRVGKSTWECMRNKGVNFAVVRGYQSNGRVDANAAATVSDARAAGIPYVDVYIFPCYRCGNPAQQVRDTAQQIHGYGMIWLDIEGTQYWSSSQTANRNFISAMIQEANNLGVKLGIYTSKYQWDPIVGDWAGGAHYPLWYAHYDGHPSFSDFASFGGWSKPAIKQYRGTSTLCGAGVDYDWYP